MDGNSENVQVSGGPDLSGFKDSMPSPFGGEAKPEQNNSNGAEKDFAKSGLSVEKAESSTLSNNNSLLDSTESIKDDNSWSWSNDKAGEGPKPQWMRENFKSVEEQAKAYNELVKKFGSFEKAPEKYEISDIENSKYRVVDGDKNFEEFKEMAKDMNMSQAGLNKIIKFFNDKVAPTFKPESDTINFEDEVKKLGENGNQKLMLLSQWTKNHMPDKVDTVKKMVRTAEDAKVLLDFIERASKGADIPDSLQMGYQRPATSKDLQKEMAEAIKSNDPDAKKILFEKYQKMFD